MRRSGHPSRPRARICCFVSSPKMLAIPAGNHRSPRRVNVLGRCYLTGRFSGVYDWPVLGVHRGALENIVRWEQEVIEWLKKVKPGFEGDFMANFNLPAGPDPRVTLIHRVGTRLERLHAVKASIT